MLELETEHLISAVQQRTIGSSHGITMKEILGADIPQPIKVYFRADIEILLSEELRLRHTGSRFDFNHPEVQSLQRQINSILVLNYSFAREEYLKQLDDCVHLLINYLIRPQWTLTSALFEHEERISSGAILRFLRYLAPYEHLNDIFSRYIAEKRVQEFGKKEFSTFIWKADGEFTKRKTGAELAGVISVMYEFFAFDASPDSYRMPIIALMKFFEDKGLTTVLTRLEGERVQSHESLTFDELKLLLEDVRRTSGLFEVHQRDEEPPPAATVEQPGPVQQLPSQPRQQPFIHFNFLASISDHDSRKFIKRIFKQDETAYQTALHSMNKISSWKQASKMIDEIFIENDVDPYCSEAEKFIEIIFQQYHPKR